MYQMHYYRLCGALMATLLFLSGCAGAESGNPAGSPLQSAGMQGNNSTGVKPDSTSASGTGESDAAVPNTSFTPYQAPEYAGSSFHADQAEGDENVQIDFSALGQGYVGVSVQSDTRVKVLVIKGDITYQYNVASDGTPSILPLQSGDGAYTFQVWHEVPGTGKYACMYQAEQTVQLEDEFQPFLRPSDYVNYDENSECVRKAAELAKQQEDAVGVVTAVYEYICENIDYDKEKAIDVQTNKTYLPDPDEILKSGKGICFDYAALAAAMLRSQGIPTKMVHGNVTSESAEGGYVYHAWNMFYTEETGWVAVEYSVKPGDWNRLDLTFSAGGAGSEFIGDGGNYTDMKYY